MTSIGTRNPRPIGPAMPYALGGNGFVVTNAPGVPGGAVGGATWSKKPPFSSQVTNSTVLAQTRGLLSNVLTTCPVSRAPVFGGVGGCSSSPGGTRTQETDGRVPAATSATKSCG